MSQLKVNALVSYSGNTVTLGTSGDTINVASGVTFNTASATINYPAGSIANAAIASNAAIATTKLGAGAVLQVVSANDATQRSTSSTSYVTASNTLSVSITPSSSSNKILIIGNTTMTNNTANKFSYLTVFRDSTNLISAGTAAFVNFYSRDSLDYNSNGFSFLDSPSSTSTITYQVYLKADTGSTAYINASDSTGALTAFEIKG